MNPVNSSVAKRSRDTPATLPVMFLRRIEDCKGTLRSNCIGTALYITGEMGKDEFVPPDCTHLMWLSDLGRISRPVLGCLAAWERKDDDNIYVAHMGVMTSLHPLQITERYEADGEFTENKPFPFVHREYNGYWPSYHPHRLGLYLPKVLASATRAR